MSLARVGVAHLLDQPEVDDFQHVVLAAGHAQHQVAGFHVAMHPAAGVGFLERAAGLAKGMHHACHRHRPMAAHDLLDRGAGQVLHRVIPAPLARGPVVVDLDRVRVRKLAAELRFALEAGHRLVRGEVRLEDLDGSRAFQVHVPREVDVAHSPLANLALEAIDAHAPRLAQLYAHRP